MKEAYVMVVHYNCEFDGKTTHTRVFKDKEKAFLALEKHYLKTCSGLEEKNIIEDYGFNLGDDYFELYKYHDANPFVGFKNAFGYISKADVE